MSNITATFTYDPNLVCKMCKTNDSIHYNLFIMHGKDYLQEDPECGCWCDTCCLHDPVLIDPDEEKNIRCS